MLGPGVSKSLDLPQGRSGPTFGPKRFKVRKLGDPSGEIATGQENRTNTNELINRIFAEHDNNFELTEFDRGETQSARTMMLADDIYIGGDIAGKNEAI